MKIKIIAVLIAASMIMMSCNSSGKKSKKESVPHEHKEGDGHDHGAEKDHDHGAKDGHDHSKENIAKSEDHGAEISFTKKQAVDAGLKIEEVAEIPFRNVIRTSGQIQGPQGAEQTVVATASGVVSFVNGSIAEGTAVKAGEAIVTISSSQLQDGNPAVKAKIAFETAAKEYNRAKELAKDQIISAKEFEQVRSRYETAKTVYEAQAGRMTESGVRVVAPMSGYIKNRLVAEGAYVNVGEPIVTIAQNRRLQLRAEVAEVQFKHLKNVSGANFRTPYDGITYKLSDLNGRLLSYGKNSSNSSFYIPVTFEFDNVGDLIPGTFAEIFLLTTPKTDVLSVPLSALTEEQGVYYVYVQEGAEAFRKQEVKTGENNGVRVEIKGGLSVGDKVVVSGAYQVKLASASSQVPDGHNH